MPRHLQWAGTEAVLIVNKMNRAASNQTYKLHLNFKSETDPSINPFSSPSIPFEGFWCQGHIPACIGWGKKKNTFLARDMRSITSYNVKNLLFHGESSASRYTIIFRTKGQDARGRGPETLKASVIEFHNSRFDGILMFSANNTHKKLHKV